MPKRNSIWLIAVILFMLLSPVIAIPLTAQHQTIEVVSLYGSTLAPYKFDSTFNFPPTPTLAPSFYIQETHIETIPTMTPRHISATTDLAKELPPEEKFIYVVLRSSGEYEQFLIPAEYSGDVRDLLGLVAQDRIITGYPFLPRQSTPVVIKPEQ